jgi:hypothetical protein
MVSHLLFFSVSRGQWPGRFHGNQEEAAGLPISLTMQQERTCFFGGSKLGSLQKKFEGDLSIC